MEEQKNQKKKYKDTFVIFFWFVLTFHKNVTDAYMCSFFYEGTTETDNLSSQKELVTAIVI